ncbi:MAG: 4-hydroxy-tetrahydrodipicolinate reductase [Clostridiales bacterium]|nr:4-hydroxy-tetrahydrodipicolinate reductase [Clostridiales bacterium]
MIKIAVTGACGKMGRVISEIVKGRDDCKVIAGIDIAGEAYDDFPVYKKLFDMDEKPDVIIDYSHNSALVDLLTYGKNYNIPLVIATTGFSDEQIAEIHKASHLIPIFFTFNMSLGINLLAELAKKAASVLGNQFDIEIVEKHHNQKKDAPSGTAIMLAEAINEEFDGNKRYVYDRHNSHKPREKDEIGMHAIRGGTIVGEHDVIFAGRDEVITLSHTAQSREVFASGSVNAAVFIQNKAKGLYAMSDLIGK